MSEAYPIPAGRHTVEHRASRSRFIATVDEAPTVEAARALLDEMRRRYPDARHHVHAFAVGFGPSVIHGASDDGEPPGTAGRPSLAVVVGSGMGDLCLVTTRYFGGVKLGTGGLVRAYTEAAQAVLATVPRRLKVERRGLRLVLDHPAYAPARRLIEAAGGELGAQDFGARVTLEFAVAERDADALIAALTELCAGRIAIESLAVEALGL